MNKKSGISLVIVSTAVVIMLTLISVASVVGSNAINSANYDEFISNIRRVSDDVNEYSIENGKLPVTNEVITVSSLGEEFRDEANLNGDLNNKLFVVDISLLNDTTVKNGTGNTQNQDVYLVAEDTNNVYYMKGFRYKSKMYYGVE